MQKPNILVLLGTNRPTGNGHKVLSWLKNVLSTVDVASFTFAELGAYPLPLFADAVNPSSRQGKHENPDVQRWLDLIDAHDGYIIVTPEYNHSYPGALKNAIDYGFKEWNNKAIGFIGYGGAAGGSRAIEHLRQIAAELALYDVREQTLIPIVWSAFDSEGNLANSDIHAKSATTVVGHVAELATKLKS